MAVSSSTLLVAYLALFAFVGVAFVAVNLTIGIFLRPDDPHEEKLEIYECGEPTIGSSFVQFDLRFYVVALLFIIFDVEVAMFFPWATVFGKAVQLADTKMESVVVENDQLAFTRSAAALQREMGIRQAAVPTPTALDANKLPQPMPASAASAREAATLVRDGARQLALFSIFDILTFFAVLMVGFAYVWRRGDLDWVRAVTRERRAQTLAPDAELDESPAALSA